jgi:hypothetical protein
MSPTALLVATVASVAFLGGAAQASPVSNAPSLVGAYKGDTTSTLAAGSQTGVNYIDTFVVVDQTGVNVTHIAQEATLAAWGVVLRNTSKTHDAVNVLVVVNLVGPHGGALPDQTGQVKDETLAVIPAGQAFYLGGDSSQLGDYDVRGVEASVTIGSTPKRRYGLPSVSDVHVNASTGNVTGTVTNPYSTSISPDDYGADLVLFDRHGRVIGGSNDGVLGPLGKSTNIKPGAHASVSFLSPVPGIRAASARITVFPH